MPRLTEAEVAEQIATDAKRVIIACLLQKRTWSGDELRQYVRIDDVASAIVDGDRPYLVGRSSRSGKGE